jgi:hypothetical protein
VTLPSRSLGCQAAGERAAICTQPGREYLSIGQLAELTPWSADAIRTMIRRGTFKRGVHYFQPLGQGRQVIFKWSAIVALIEGTGDAQRTMQPEQLGADVRSEVSRIQRSPIDVETATAALERMLD